MRVNAKGQVTIPQEIQKMLNIAPGMEVVFIVGEDNRIYIEKVVNQPGNTRFQRMRKVAT
jgi:AbrB family looped-hinge helix DNA binding protein